MAVPAKQARITLSPPEATYYNESMHSVGKDPLVRVNPVRTAANGSFIITLRVRELQKVLRHTIQGTAIPFSTSLVKREQGAG